MFRSIRLRDRRTILALGVCVLGFLIVCLTALHFNDNGGQGVDRVMDENDATALFSSLGIGGQVVLTRDITVPERFDDAYACYAALQQAQGLSLDSCKGKPATLYLCAIDDGSTAELLVCDGEVIAADRVADGTLYPLYETGEP